MNPKIPRFNPPATLPPASVEFEQPVVLQQTGLWSHAILWALVSTVIGVITWAAYAPIEPAIQVRGELKPSSQVKEVRLPLTGVVQQVYVQEGDEVQKGQVPFTLDLRINQAELKPSRRVRDNLVTENRINRALLNEDLSAKGLSRDEQATLNESYRVLKQEFWLSKSASASCKTNYDKIKLPWQAIVRYLP